jgi:SAM-dependent methyltransferase
MGNDGRSATAAKRIAGFAKQNIFFNSPKDALNALESETQETAPPPWTLKLIKKFSFIFVLIILPFYYLFTFLALFPYWVRGCFRGAEFEQKLDPVSWGILFSHWGKYPHHSIVKAVECYWFREQTIEKPSLEIGVYRGDTSRSVFHNRKLDVGMEFVPTHLFHFARLNIPIHQHLACGDIYEIPIQDQAFQSVFTVHSLDDIQRGIDVALSEISRVMKPGGKLVFSSYSGNFGNHNIGIFLLRKMGLNNIAKKLFDWIFVGTDNIYDDAVWADKLRANGFKIERLLHFIPMSVSRLMDIPYRLEGFLINLFGFHGAIKIFMTNKTLNSIYKNLLMTILKGIWSVSRDSKGNELPGMNIFVVARKASAPDKDPVNQPFEFKKMMRCIYCNAGLKFDPNEAKFMVCSGCGKKYPNVSDIPVLLRNASFPG